MDSVQQLLPNALRDRGFPKIAALWRTFLEQGCTIYLLSDPNYGARDAYALFWIGRYLHPMAAVEVVPWTLGGDIEEEISTKNLIILGRVRTWEGEELMGETLGTVTREYAHFRFIDRERLLQIETGELFEREERRRRIRDFGVLRLWCQQDIGRVIMNCAGLGPVGTLAATMALTDLNGPAMAEVEALLPPNWDEQRGLVEILTEAEWRPKDNLDIVRPSDVAITVVSSFNATIQPNWPLMEFRRIADDGDWQYEVLVIDAKRDRAMRLTQSRTDFAVLAAVGRHTENEPSLYAEKGGYISYEQIGESDTAKEIIPTGLDTPTVTSAISRLRQTLERPEWYSAFPNLLLESTAYSRKARRKIVVLRLRARFKWWSGKSPGALVMRSKR